MDEHVRRLVQDGREVEAPRRFGEVTMGVLGESNGVVGAIQRTLDVVQHRVYPATASLIAGTATTAGATSARF